MSAYLSNESVEFSTILPSWDTQYNWDIPEDDNSSVNLPTVAEPLFEPFQTQDLSNSESFDAIFLPINQENTFAHDNSRFELLDDDDALNDPVLVNTLNTATVRPPRKILPSSNLPDQSTVVTPRKPRWYSYLHHV